MFDKEMKSAISKAIQLGLEKGFDVEKSVLETLDLAEKGELPSEVKSNSAPIVKTFEIKNADVDLENRIVSGYAATWDLDQVDDIIHRGAFSKSIQERMPANKIKVLSQHDVLIGKPVEMYEDEKGLFVSAYISPTTRGNDDLQLVKDGVLDRFSIGFSIPGGKYEIDEKGIRHIYEVKLMEFSLVTFPANEAAIVLGVKAAFEEQVRKAEEVSESNTDNEESEDDDTINNEELEDNSNDDGVEYNGEDNSDEETEKAFEDFANFFKSIKSKNDEAKEVEAFVKSISEFASNKQK